VTEGVKEFFEDWLPRAIRARDVVERIKIPQADFFGFGEKLAVIEQGTTDPQGMGFAYQQIASFLASDFANLSALVGEQAVRAATRIEEAKPARVTAKPSESADYLYDIFVSYDHSMSEWVLEFVEALKQELTGLRADELKTFMDLQVLRLDQSWEERLSEAVTRSRVLLAFLTPRYVASRHARREFLTFRERMRLTGKRLVAQVLLRGDEFPDFAREILWFDFRKFSVLKTSPSHRPAAWQREIMGLADALNNMMNEAPPYDPGWKLASDKDIEKGVDFDSERTFRTPRITY